MIIARKGEGEQPLPEWPRQVVRAAIDRRQVLVDLGGWQPRATGQLGRGSAMQRLIRPGADRFPCSARSCFDRRSGLRRGNVRIYVSGGKG